MTILILSGIIILVGITSFFVIKKLIGDKKSLQFKLDFADKQLDFYRKNRALYQRVVEETTKDKKNADKIREKIYSSDGSDLADILNEL
jgi:predicted Holliday junction resolvase-like endonuclease